MAEKSPEKKNSRIHERIVPRNNVKRGILLTLSVIGLAALFGLIAGVAFKIGETLVGQNVETRIEQFIIARDDTESESEETTLKPEDYQQAKESQDAMTQPESVPEPTVPASPAMSADTVLKEAKRSVVEVVIEKNAGKDLFEEQIIDRHETIGVFVIETADYFYLMTDDSRYEQGDRVSVNLSDTFVPAEFVQRDELTGLTVHRIPADAMKKGHTVMNLGNSFTLGITQTVYMLGTQTGNPLSFSSGKVTYIDNSEAVEDGYSQHIYTDIACSGDATGLLLNEEGVFIGWVSDFYCGTDGVVSAGGISPLKYLIEDMCSGLDTAYMGLTCSYVPLSMSKLLGIAEGLYVESVRPDSPAFTAGIQPGDQLVSIDGKRVQSNTLLSHRLDDYRPGDEATVQLMRRSSEGYAPLELPIVFGTR